MSSRKAKSDAKIFETDPAKLQDIVIRTMKRISEGVGSSLGPGGRVTLIESDYPGIPNKITKDGVTIFKSLGAHNAYEHLVIETARDVAQRTATEAGDGTTTATVLSYAIISNLFAFCKANPKYSPQKAARRIAKITKEMLLPYITSRSIPIGEHNQEMLNMVAKISANGDQDMADAVIKAFEEIGYGENSHVTIRELSGPPSYQVERIDGLPITMGYEESIGKMHTAFINDQGNQRTYLEKPLFILFDGQVNDLISIAPLLELIGEKYAGGDTNFKNVVIFSYGYSQNVINTLAFNFQNQQTINVMPMVAPMAQFANSQLHFLHDLSAFTGAKVFGMRDQLSQATPDDLGKGMEFFEAYRFRSTVVGDPDPVNVEVRAEEIKKMLTSPEGQAERIFLEERLGKITNGIAKLTIFGGSNGELKEAHDRCEDAVCAVRSAIAHGALPGGCRIAIDMSLKLGQTLEKGDPAREVLMYALLSLPKRLLSNAGYSEQEAEAVIEKLLKNPGKVYDVENQVYGTAEKLGLFDATKAVEQSLSNAVSIANVLGTLGGIVCHPRDDEFERSEARLDSAYMKAVEDPYQFENEANGRG